MDDKGSWVRRLVEDFGGTACSVFSSLAIDCGVNISLIYPTVLASNTENLLVKWGMGVTIDQPENPLLPSWPSWPFWVHPSHPLLPRLLQL